MVHMDNIWAISNRQWKLQRRLKKTKERKRRRHKEKKAEKKAKVTSLQDKLDQQAQVHQMVVVVGGSRLPVEDIERDGVVLLINIVDSFLAVVGMIAEESGTQLEGPRADVVEPMP